MNVVWPAKPRIQSGVILAPHSSWLVGGPADFFAEPSTVQEIAGLQDAAAAAGLQVTVLGGGTNVLISDGGVRGLVISLSKFSGIEILEQSPRLRFWALAGTPKSELLKIFLKHKLAPAKFLAGLPGQAGGGVVMNAGVSENLVPREFHDITEAVEILRPSGRLEVLSSSKLEWGYRHCEGWKPGIITRVLLACENIPSADVVGEVRKLNQSRLQKQPLEWPSCGSVFRNPLPEHAGRLIESCGLKGHSIGGAQVSEKHANFIVNKGQAKARDIRDLMDLCVQRVKDRFNVELKSEVIWLGEPANPGRI